MAELLRLRERSTSPWYPTMRLFRQPRPGEWGEVFERIAAEVHISPLCESANTCLTTSELISRSVDDTTFIGRDRRKWHVSWTQRSGVRVHLYGVVQAISGPTERLVVLRFTNESAVSFARSAKPGSPPGCRVRHVYRLLAGPALRRRGRAALQPLGTEAWDIQPIQRRTRVPKNAVARLAQEIIGRIYTSNQSQEQLFRHLLCGAIPIEQGVQQRHVANLEFLAPRCLCYVRRKTRGPIGHNAC